MAAVTTSMLKQTNETAIAGPPQAQVYAAPSGVGETDVEEAPETRRELVLVAAELSARRDRGLMDGSLEELRKVHVVGSPALAVDAKVVARMQDLGLRLEALKTSLNEVSVLPGKNALEATIEATSVQSGYRYVDRKGAVIASAKKSESQRVRMVLRFVDGSWRMWQVTGSK